MGQTQLGLFDQPTGPPPNPLAEHFYLTRGIEVFGPDAQPDYRVTDPAWLKKLETDIFVLIDGRTGRPIPEAWVVYDPERQVYWHTKEYPRVDGGPARPNGHATAEEALAALVNMVTMRELDKLRKQRRKVER